ncbi:PTS lactose/cellobiose transporter subunit IIA [Metabacillus mangrovi]|uniref:PTS lactose/cellobiose transporter subunit IIA n=1 Tax=Metabacillus mangrovi TaxID=1491830 RepID=UPI0030C8375A
MQDLELIPFQIISEVGAARSSFMEALMHGRKGEYAEAKEKVLEAQAYLSAGHKVHAGLVQKEAAGEEVKVTLLMVHAEDLMITTETMGEMVKEMIHMYKEFRRS